MNFNATLSQTLFQDNQETWKIHDAWKHSLIETVCLITPPSTEVMQPDGEFSAAATVNTKNWICTKNIEVSY